MLSFPVFTIRQSPLVLVTDKHKLGTLNNIRNLNLRVFFFKLTHIQQPQKYPFQGLGWIDMCEILANMRTLRHLRISILQKRFNWEFEHEEQSRSEQLVRQLLEPLKAINLAGQGGTFEIVTQGWKVPDVLDDDVPLVVMQEPQAGDLPSKVFEGCIPSFSELMNMPWPMMLKNSRRR